jgi:hypothetical protein
MVFEGPLLVKSSAKENREGGDRNAPDEDLALLADAHNLARLDGTDLEFGTGVSGSARAKLCLEVVPGHRLLLSSTASLGEAVAARERSATEERGEGRRKDEPNLDEDVEALVDLLDDGSGERRTTRSAASNGRKVEAVD